MRKREGEGEGLQDRGKWRSRSGGNGETSMERDSQIANGQKRWSCLDMCGGRLYMVRLNRHMMHH